MRQEATRSLDQRLVNWLEQRTVSKLLRDYGLQGRLLDVPCGYGRFWPTFSGLGTRFFGVDLDPEMVRLADESNGYENGRRAICGDVFQLPFADDAFETTVSIRLLHLNYTGEQRQQILRELVRVSRRFVLISLYRFTPLHGLVRRWHSTPGRVRLMTENQLEDLVISVDVRLELLQPLHRFLHMQTFALLSKKASPS